MHDRAFEVSKHCAVLQRQRRLAVWGVKRSMQAPPAQPSPPPGPMLQQPWTPVHRLRTAGAATPSSASKKRCAELIIRAFCSFHSTQWLFHDPEQKLVSVQLHPCTLTIFACSRLVPHTLCCPYAILCWFWCPAMPKHHAWPVEAPP